MQNLCLRNLRIRRRKCNEAKPACMQCISTGWICDFVQASRNFHFLGSHSRKDQHEPNPILSPQILSLINLKPFEARHFEYFQQVCTKEFSLYFEFGLWEGVILGAACTEPCIMHAVLAIAALSRSQIASQAYLELE
jgi:hypothetical protein